MKNSITDIILRFQRKPSTNCMLLETETYKQSLQANELSGSGVGLVLQLFAANSKNVLEIGTLTGLGTLYIAEALPEDGIVYTIDNDFDGPKKDLALKYWGESGLTQKIKQFDANASLIQEIFDEEFFDMVFIDGQNSEYQQYIEDVLPLVRSRGVIIIDDTLDGDLINPKTIREKNTATFNRNLYKDQSFLFVQIINVGEGLTIAIKK